MRALFLSLMLAIFFSIATDKTANAASATLDITSNQGAVDIRVNGQIVGKTPISGLEVTSGTVTIQATKPGFGSSNQSITLQANEVRRIHINLEPSQERTGTVDSGVVLPQDTGSIIVTNQIPNAQVFLNGVLKGTGSLKVVNVAAGIHTLTVADKSTKFSVRKNFLVRVRVSNTGFSIVDERIIPPHLKNALQGIRVQLTICTPKSVDASKAARATALQISAIAEQLGSGQNPLGACDWEWYNNRPYLRAAVTFAPGRGRAAGVLADQISDILPGARAEECTKPQFAHTGPWNRSECGIFDLWAQHPQPQPGYTVSLNVYVFSP